MNIAAKVWSHSVPAGMSFLVTCKELPEDAIHTAQFIEHFDALSNTSNSQRIRSSQRLGHAFSDSSGHYAFLQDMIKYLTTVNAYEGLELPCIYGWKLSINALFGLWHYLKEGYEFLLTSGLNQDCIKNLFNIIHGKGGFRDNPDVQQFKAAFKYVVAYKLFVQSGSSNCNIDSDTKLLYIAIVAMVKYIKPLPNNVENAKNTDIVRLIRPPMTLQIANIAVYISGVLLQKIPPNDYTECMSNLSCQNYLQIIKTCLCMNL